MCIGDIGVNSEEHLTTKQNSKCDIAQPLRVCNRSTVRVGGSSSQDWVSPGSKGVLHKSTWLRSKPILVK